LYAKDGDEQAPIGVLGYQLPQEKIFNLFGEEVSSLILLIKL
jgi:hypothetical protein